MKYIICLLVFFAAASQSYGQDNIRRLDSLMRTYYTQTGPGAVVLVSRNKQLVFKKGYGLANLATKEKISSATNFNIGSITKQFTAYCIAQLAEQKKISLQDNLLKYFPGFNQHTGSLITIQQLLTHSSGIIDHYAFTDTNLVKHATDKDVLQAVQHIDSTYFTPGTQYRYSNTAYCLLAMIIEKISGLSYAAYIKKNIFDPLSMQHAVVLQMGKPIYKKATGYDYNGNTKQFSQLDAAEAIFFSTEGDGGIYTSADDYLRWFQFLQQPSPASKAAVEKCRSPQFTVAPQNKLSYGYGWFISEQDAAKAVYHSGSNGGFRAFVFTVPSTNYIVAVFSNRTGVDLETMVKQINTILGVTNNSFTKIEALVSFIHTSPIFAPCKEIL